MSLDAENNVVHFDFLRPNETKLTSMEFDKVYDSRATQQEIYKDLVLPLVEGALEGINGAVYAYGQTGAGKNFTFFGVDDLDIPLPGLVFQATDTIFENIYSKDNALVKISFIQIYNENLKDLLDEGKASPFNIKESHLKGTYKVCLFHLEGCCCSINLPQIQIFY